MLAGPRFFGSDPAVDASLGEVRLTLDRWLDERTREVLTCKKGCFVEASCEVTRNDGEFLSLSCTHSFSFADWRSGSARAAFVFRREGARFSRISPQSFARDAGTSVLLRLLPASGPDTERPLSDEQDLPAFDVALHDDAFEVDVALPFVPEPTRMFRSFSDVAQHLRCDAMLAFPPRPSSKPLEVGALALATHVVDGAEEEEARRWFGDGSSVDYPRFAAEDPELVEAARQVEVRLEAFHASVRHRAEEGGWSSVTTKCHAATSTRELVSVLCHGGASAPSGEHRVVRGSITLRIGASPAPVTVAELLVGKPDAPSRIARRCFGALVRKPRAPTDEVLVALPKLSAMDLEDFAVWQGGVLFAIEYDIAGRRELMPCWVPHVDLGPAVGALPLPKAK